MTDGAVLMPLGNTPREGDEMRKKTIFFASLVVLLLSLIACKATYAMEFIFKDMQYSFQALRTIGYAVSGGADIGECLKTLYKVKEGDDESWYTEWYNTGQEREKAGDAFLSKGFRISARQEYLRASNYFRNAEFFLRSNPNDLRILFTSRKSRDNFIKWARLADFPVKPIRVPFEGTTLPGYYLQVDRTGKKRPLLIIHSGFDGTAEEVYLETAHFALQRGYNCLIFEGPGQGKVIREQNIPFRPNWETVVSPVVDFALGMKDVDQKRIALMGISLGGYLAPRAVAFERRIKACIANGGIYDFHAVSRLTPELEKALDTEEGAREIDREIYERMKRNPSIRWTFGNGMFTFHAKTPSEWLRMTRPYTMKGIADRIQCQMLVVDSEEDKDVPGQARQLYDALTCPKTFLLFTKAEAAEEHCQMGAVLISNQRILDWLDTIMKRR
jgi:dipeptidyl aminopeptidase/acylaminoacyl peptidase